MSESVILSCLNCGNQLEIAEEIERFACASCGQELLVRRGGGIVYLVALADDSSQAVGQGGPDTSQITRLTKEIKALKDQLWTEKEGIPQQSLYNFFVMLDDLGYERRGKKRSKGFFSLITKRDSSEGDIRNVLDTLTVSELDKLSAKCVELTEKGVDMEHYQAAFQQIKWLEKDLLRTRGQIGL